MKIKNLYNLFISIIFSIILISVSLFWHYSFASANHYDSQTAFDFVSAMNAGLNIGNSLDACYGEATGDANLSQETVWGNPLITKQYIDYIKSLHFDVIRLPVTWHTHMYRDENGIPHIHKDWFQRVKDVVDYCISDDLYVIINIHHDGELIHTGVTTDSFSTVKTNASALWSEISNYFASYDDHLIFEAYNEVDNYERSWSYGKKAASQMNELNQLFVDTVRSSGGYNSTRFLMIPTLLDSTDYNCQKSFKLPKDSANNRLIITVHDYSQQFDQTLDTDFSNLEKFSKKQGAPIIIGEWGTTDSYIPEDFRSIHASNFIARAKAHGIKCIYWDNGSNYSIISRNESTCNQEVVSAIMNPLPYQSDSMTSLTDWNDFLYMTFNLETGALKEDRHWGTIVVNKDGEGKCIIPSNKTLMSVNLVVTESMSEQRIHCLYFFNANDELIYTDKDVVGYNEKIIEIPNESTYVRIGINNPYNKTSASEYKKAIKSGHFAFVINFY